MRLLISLLLTAVLCGNSLTQSAVSHADSVIDTLYAYVDDKHNTYFEYLSQSDLIPADLAEKFHVRESEMLVIRTKSIAVAEEAGHSVLIPFSTDDLLVHKSYTTDCIPVMYTVRPKETVFKIARRYFDLKVDQLRKMNGLTSNNISIDQQLIVGWFILHPVMESIHSSGRILPVAEPVDSFYPEEPKSQFGLAIWKSSETSSSHMFAMHRTARINSLIEITNPMFDTRVLVKVVGRIPPTYEQDICLVVSPAVANKLGVLDPRFRAEMRFVE